MKANAGIILKEEETVRANENNILAITCKGLAERFLFLSFLRMHSFPSFFRSRIMNDRLSQ